MYAEILKNDTLVTGYDFVQHRVLAFDPIPFYARLVCGTV